MRAEGTPPTLRAAGEAHRATMSTWSRRLSSTSLVGRDDEVRLVVDAASPGGEHLSVVLVSGPPGIGKSRLVAEAAYRLRTAGTRVVLGACLDLGEGAPPYAALIAAFREGDSPACEQALAMMTGRVEANRASIFEEVRSGLVALTASRPTVLVVEDLHWADQGTRDMLVYLTASVPSGRWSLLGTYRDEDLATHPDARRLVSTLARDPVHHLELGPLSVDAVLEQIEEISGEPVAAADAVRIHQRTGGVPLYVEEVVAAGGAGASAVPPHLRATFLDRVSTLPHGVRDVVVVAAVMGTGCDPALVGSVLGRPPDEVGEDLDRAVAAGVLNWRPEGCRARHELLREAVYDDIPAPRRRELHAAAARALSRRPGAEPELVAHHWAAAGDDTRAGAAYLAAADAAARLHSPGGVHAHLEQVIARWDRLDPEVRSATGSRAALFARAAEAAALAGSPRAVALGEQRRAMVRDDPVDLAAACERLARYHWTAGNGRGTSAAFDDALAALPADAPDDVRARVLAGHAWILAMTFREEAAARQAEEALSAARRSGNPLETCRALLAWGASHSHDPRSPGTLEEARRLAVRLDSVDEIARSHIALARAMRRAGSSQEEIGVLREGLRLTRVHGAVTYQAVLAYLLIEALVDVGKWTDAAGLARELDRLPVGGTARAFGSAQRARLAAHQGDPDATRVAAEAIDLSQDIAEQPAPAIVAHLAIAEARLWRAEPDPAQRHADEALALAGVDAGLQAAAAAVSVRAAADLADLARLHGEPVLTANDAAARVAVLATSGADITPRVLAYVATARAELSRLAAGRDPRPWREAVVAWERAQDPYAVAYAQWRLVPALLASRPKRSEAADLLRRARKTAGALGARPLLAAIDRLAGSARLAPHAESAGLTAREHEVLRLVAAGRTNAEIADVLVISPRTVGVHVSRLLRKLRAARRTEAADIARRAGLLDDR